MCVCGPERTTLHERAWICSNDKTAHLLCALCKKGDRCWNRKHSQWRIVGIGSMMKDIHALSKRHFRPFVENVAYVATSTEWKEFRFAIMNRNDLVLKVHPSDGTVHTSIKSLFASASRALLPNVEFVCSSDVRGEILVADPLQLFLAHVTYHFSKRSPEIEFRPKCWLPAVSQLYKFTLTVTPGNYEYIWILHPCRFQPKFRVDTSKCPQPPPGAWRHTITFTIAPVSSP